MNQNFTRNILVMSKATVKRNGIEDFYNTHVQSVSNSHAYKETNFKDRFSVKVRAAITSDILVGPFILSDRLMSESNLKFSQNHLPGCTSERYRYVVVTR